MCYMDGWLRTCNSAHSFRTVSLTAHFARYRELWIVLTSIYAIVVALSIVFAAVNLSIQKNLLLHVHFSYFFCAFHQKNGDISYKVIDESINNKCLGSASDRKVQTFVTSHWIACNCSTIVRSIKLNRLAFAMVIFLTIFGQFPNAYRFK